MIKINILWISNSSYGGYGYSIVTKNIVSRIKKHRVIILGMQTIGKPIEDEFSSINLPINNDPWGSDSLPQYLAAYDIDLLISVIDLWVNQLAYLPQLVQKHRIPWIAHVTINSSPLSPYIHSRVINADKIVAPSKFNLRELQNAGLRQAVYIPHGVDLKKFHPLKKKEKQKIKEEWGLEDKFIIGIVQRNKGPQKNFPTAFHSLKILLESVPDARKDVIMLILSNPNEIEGINLLDLTKRADLQNNVRIVKVLPTDDWKRLRISFDSKAFYTFPNFKLDEFELNRLYNVFDIHLVPSQGESFGLPVIESMSAGIPNIMAAFGTGPELIVEGEPTPRGMLAELVKDKSGEPYLTSTPLISAISNPSPTSMAECIYKFYTDESFKKECSRNARKFAKKYSWNKIVKEGWIPLLEEFNRPKPVNYRTGDLGV